MAGKLALAAIHLGTVVAEQFLAINHVLAPDATEQVREKTHGASAIGKVMPLVGSFALEKMSADPDDTQLQGVEDSLEALVLKGDDPANRLAIKSMTDFLVKTLIPNREKQLKADQEQLDAQMSDIKECSLRNARKADMPLNDKLEQAAEHKADYASGVQKLGTCLNMTETRSWIKDAHCISLDDAEQKCACHKDIKEVMGPACKKNTVIGPAYKTCCDKFAAYKLHQLKCQSTKHSTDHARLQAGIIKDDVCSQYSSCYTKQVNEYKYVEQVVKGNEKRRLLGKLYSIKCLVEAFDTGKITQTEVKSCKEKKFNVKTVNFQQIPTKDACTIPWSH